MSFGRDSKVGRGVGKGEGVQREGSRVMRLLMGKPEAAN